jgi:ATP-binding cassette, subfamily B (MDR/TAP), member 1
MASTMESAPSTTQTETSPSTRSTIAATKATIAETFSFVFACGPRIKWIFALGVIGGIAHGVTFPILAFTFSTGFTGISGAAMNGIGMVRDLAYRFLIIGVYAMVAGTVQTWSFEVVAQHATRKLQLQWFSALLRQDAAYFDVYDMSGIAAQIGPSTMQYRRGVGRKFGEGVQFLTIAVGGVAFAIWSSWRVALVVLACVPFMVVSLLAVVHLNQSKSVRGAAAYKTAGSVAYTTVSAIKTVLSINAITTMIQKYSDATQEAYSHATSILIQQGFANGTYSSIIHFVM